MSMSPLLYLNSKPIYRKTYRLFPFSNIRRSLPEGFKPVQVADNLDIARKPKAAPASAGEESTNGQKNGTTNGTSTSDTAAAGAKRKRSLEETTADLGNAQKLQKMGSMSRAQVSNGKDSVFIEESTDGAIVIDDD